MEKHEKESQAHVNDNLNHDPSEALAGGDHANGELMELTELEAEDVSGGLLPVNEGCINAYKC